MPVGVVNPAIFRKRNLEYRLRFCRAPRLAETLAQLRGGHPFNAYRVRGEHDVVLVSVESQHAFYKAFLEGRLEELGLTDRRTFTVGEFLKYHGRRVAPIQAGGEALLEDPEALHQLFNLSRDWDSVPEPARAGLAKANLLLGCDPGGVGDGSSGGAARAAIARIGLEAPAGAQDAAALRRWCSQALAEDPRVRSLYASGAGPDRYVVEMVGGSADIDALVIRAQDELGGRFPGLRAFVRVDEVMRRLFEGRINVLLTLQTRPELLDLAEQRLIGPMLCAEKSGADLLAFLERAQAAIRSVRPAELQRECLGMLSELQKGLPAGGPEPLREALEAVCRRTVRVMVARLAQVLGCPADEESVVAMLKERRLLRDHCATLGSLSPAFIELAGRAPAGKAPTTVFGRLNDLRNSLSLAGREPAGADARRRAEGLFCELVETLPGFFGQHGGPDPGPGGPDPGPGGPDPGPGGGA